MPQDFTSPLDALDGTFWAQRRSPSAVRRLFGGVRRAILKARADREAVRSATTRAEEEAARLQIIQPKIYRETSKRYQAKPFHGPLTLFRTQDEERTDMYKDDQVLGWGEVALGRFEILDVPGAHLSCLQHPNVKVIADRLTETMKRVSESK